MIHVKTIISDFNISMSSVSIIVWNFHIKKSALWHRYVTCRHNYDGSCIYDTGLIPILIVTEAG